MKHDTSKKPKWLSVAIQVAGLCALALPWLAGCTSSERVERVIPTPQTPAFFAGPAAVLLTNAGGFTGYAVMEGGPDATPGKMVEGALLGRDGKLLFVPELKSAGKKDSRAGEVSFIWDVAESRGFLLSETMQGYAPISSGVRVSNVVAGVERPASERVQGHPCAQAEVTVASSDGASTVFKVWRATDMKGFPVRITTATPVPMTLEISKIRLAPPPAELFGPPEGFTRYTSAEAMMAELVMRQHNLRRKPAEESLEGTPGPGGSSPGGSGIRPGM